MLIDNRSDAAVPRVSSGEGGIVTARIICFVFEVQKMKILLLYSWEMA